MNLRADAPAASIAVLACAVAFHLAGCALLVSGAAPLAALHAFAAFIVLAVIATSHQLIPVLLRVPPGPWLHTVTLGAGFAIGFAVLIASFMGLPWFVAAGSILAFSAALWCAFVGSRVLRAAAERRTAFAMGTAFAAFLIAMLLGAWMAYDLGAGAAPEQRTAALHGTLMVVVFASVLIFVLSYRFVPMFALSHADAYGKRSLQWVFIAGTATMALGSAVLGAALNLIALCALAYQHVRTIRMRMRKNMDVSLTYATVAWSFAIAAALHVCLHGITSSTVVPVLGLSVLGWLSITIFGYGLKICGFLSWQYARERFPQSALMPLSNAVPRLGAYVALGCLALGAAFFAAGGDTGAVLTQLASAVYLGGALAYAATFCSILYPYVFRSMRVST